MERKVVNDAVAYIRGLAELRGRNAEWAESAVRGAASLSAHARRCRRRSSIWSRSDVPDLLARIDGREVRVADRTVKLATRDARARAGPKPDWRTQLLAVITHPTVAYGLMLIGIWGLLLEGYNPGAVLPGVAGSICLLIALFAFQMLSVNYAGLALVAVGVGHDRRRVLLSDLWLARHRRPDRLRGRLAHPVRYGRARHAGGALADRRHRHRRRRSSSPASSTSRRALRRPVATGAQAMIGASAEVVADFSGRGRVRYGGELWNAQQHCGAACRRAGAHREGGRSNIVGRAAVSAAARSSENRMPFVNCACWSCS